MRISDLRRLCYAKLDGDEEFHRNAEVDLWIVLHARLVARLLGKPTVRSSIQPTVPDEMFYELPQEIEVPLELWFEGRRLSRSSRQSMDGVNPRWMREPSSDSGPELWFWYTTRSVCVWPADAFGGGRIDVIGVPRIPVPSSDDDDVPIAEEAVPIVVDLAAHMCLYKEGGKRLADDYRVNVKDSYERLSRLLKTSLEQDRSLIEYIRPKLVEARV